MKIESIKLKNFKSFKNIEMTDIPNFCVLVGENGAGKSTIFSVFAFLKEAFTSNVNTAIVKLGGSRGLKEVITRGSEGAIKIELKFREKKKSPLITYILEIIEFENKAIVNREILKYRRGSRGKSWHFIDFKKGKGLAVTNEIEQIVNEKELVREEQVLKSADILAVKGLAQFEKFPAVVTLGNLIENWHISDFHINAARNEQEAGYAEHLSKNGENLSIVVQYLYQNQEKIFNLILEKLKNRIPGITNIEAKTTEEGRVLLKFQDGSFEDPFLARYVSDGTIKMLAYLILLYDPKPHSLLCVEEPENQLYPDLLEELAEEFRTYANKGGQVFVSTHSPDFLNAVKLHEVYILRKQKGITKIDKASNISQIKNYMNNGDKMGYLWKQGLFDG
ncbi:MAG: AAA family ATPase [Candidatus Muiribacteriota bacterium]|jgi:predicted ATPase